MDGSAGLNTANRTSIRPLGIQERVILGLLLALAAGAWILTIYQSNANSMGMGLTMGLSASVFLAVWVVMMAAMMFPSVAPMVMLFSRISRGKREVGQSFVPTWVFVGSYLAVWAASGLVAFVAATQLQDAAMGNMWLTDNGPRLAGAVFVAAGLYQLSPLKSVCLAHCRSPLAFLLTSWKEGYLGAVDMGVKHGLFCLGCCWLLFVILFPLGIMNVAAMAVVAALIFAEKIVPQGLVVARGLGVALIAYGLLVAVLPQALPGTSM